MYLLVYPNGGKYFRLDFRFDGKWQTLALGIYPTLSLAEARDTVVDAKRKIAVRINPTIHKKAVKQANTEMPQLTLRK